LISVYWGAEDIIIRRILDVSIINIVVVVWIVSLFRSAVDVIVVN
jgi:hypothetical protein